MLLCTNPIRKDLEQYVHTNVEQYVHTDVEQYVHADVVLFLDGLLFSFFILVVSPRQYGQHWKYFVDTFHRRKTKQTERQASR